MSGGGAVLAVAGGVGQEVRTHRAPSPALARPPECRLVTALGQSLLGVEMHSWPRTLANQVAGGLFFAC